MCRLSDRQTHSHSIIESSSSSPSSLKQSNLVITTHHPFFWNTLYKGVLKGKMANVTKMDQRDAFKTNKITKISLLSFSTQSTSCMHTAHIIPTIKKITSIDYLEILHKNLRSPTPHHRWIHHHLIMCT